MLSVLGILNEIRRRPGMYLGEKSLTKLAAFVDGYGFGLHQAGVEDPFALIADFRDWIHARHQTTAVNWDALILAASKDEGEALDRFWKLLDEFLANHPEHVEKTTERASPFAAPTSGYAPRATAKPA
jgi:hypothetical protein